MMCGYEYYQLYLSVVINRIKKIDHQSLKIGSFVIDRSGAIDETRHDPRKRLPTLRSDSFNWIGHADNAIRSF